MTNESYFVELEYVMYESNLIGKKKNSSKYGHKMPRK